MKLICWRRHLAGAPSSNKSHLCPFYIQATKEGVVIFALQFIMIPRLVAFFVSINQVNKSKKRCLSGAFDLRITSRKRDFKVLTLPVDGRPKMMAT